MTSLLFPPRLLFLSSYLFIILSSNFWFLLSIVSWRRFSVSKNIPQKALEKFSDRMSYYIESLNHKMPQKEKRFLHSLLLSAHTNV